MLVMRKRGNDELAPSRELLDEVNRLKAEYRPESGYESAYHYAWARSDYEARFTGKILGDEKARDRLQALAERSRDRDIFLVCYEGYGVPCHRHLLLRIARDHFGATVDPTDVRPAP